MADKVEKNKAEVASKSPVAEREEKTLAFWRENDIFQKSLKKASPKGNYIFYDGPPFATGLPHHGHMLPGTIKDVIPRFKTMQGYHVPRRWGWDTHGLPVENLIEKELGLKGKKDIEDLGVEKFNAAARASVLRYDQEWKRLIPRSGRWVDMDHAYLTMQPTYSESIWWSFKTLWDKHLIYQGFKVMQLCPHCGTTLSNFEVSQGYKDITDISVYAKFELLEESPSNTSGQAPTFVVAWTTTPWTLPGNTALAVNPEIIYVKVKIPDNSFVILGKDVFEKSKDPKHPLYTQLGKAEIVGEYTGKDLLNKKYKPLFDYYQNTDLKNKEHGWKIVGADFVTTTDGTGVVHIAPAFGEDDYNLSLKENLPFIQHVATDGTFKKEVTDFAGLSVKPKDTKEDSNLHQSGDVAIIKYLAGKGTLFAKEKLVHSYPHCWRCDTPLLNYATSSWFVKVTDIKDKIVAENKKVNWVPSEIGEGRFGKWLDNARDWAISRSRYWGAPLPVWICKECGKQEVIGSIADIKAKTRKNTYYVMRHGEAQNNVDNILSCDTTTPHHLSEKGKQQVADALSELKKLNIDLIISSDIIRTTETATLVANALGLDTALSFDKRLREYNSGDFNLKPIADWHAYWKTRTWGDVDIKVPGGESPKDIQTRLSDFIKDTDAQYVGKNILIVSHEDPIRFLLAYAEGENIVTVTQKKWHTYQLENAAVRKLDYALIPLGPSLELDVHRPYIDAITYPCDCGGTFKRIPEVFDTWYESGSMPYAQLHYPFENKDKIDTNTFFPADFIAEGQDQTRGWFYSLLVLGVGLFNQSPYKNVIVNGIILAEDGQKMSKRLKNYPELDIVFDKYGADALRYFLLASPAVRAEDLAFSEKGLDDVVKKIINRLDNVYTFFKTYQNDGEDFLAKLGDKRPGSNNILDQWICARLDEIAEEITLGLERLELDRATRPFMKFGDDFSTWYLRRSRDRFKGDDETDKLSALQTTQYVLRELSKLLAPFMPFMAEDLYQKVKGITGKESVHLEEWPVLSEVEGPKNVIPEMQIVRDIVSQGQDLRKKSSVNVRQPLRMFTIKNSDTSKILVGKKEYLDLIKDELNVKEVSFDETLLTDAVFDLTITPELKAEGQSRELIRAIQDLRKKANLNPHDQTVLVVETQDAGKALLTKFKDAISKTAQLADIQFTSVETETLIIDDLSFKLSLKK